MSAGKHESRGQAERRPRSREQAEPAAGRQRERRSVPAAGKRKSRLDNMPTAAQLEAELNRERQSKRFGQTLRGTVSILVVVAAVAVLIAVLVMPVLRIYGGSMNPTLTEGDIVVSLRGTDFAQGDLVSFYLGNKILVKRYIAGPGQWVDIDGDGNVYVDGAQLEEPYIREKAFGACDLELPYQVPEGRIFVLGDHRLTSVDSRSTAVGCVADEQIVGKIVFRIWPLRGIGTLR